MLFGPTIAAMCKQCAIPVTQKASKQRSLFDSGENGGDFTLPQPRFLPRKGLWESERPCSYLAVSFHVSHGSTSIFVASPNSVITSRESKSAGLL